MSDFADRHTFHATITNNALGKSKEKGTPSIKLLCHADKDITTGEPANFTCYVDLWLTFACMERTYRTLREVLKWDGDDLLEINQDPELFSGIQVHLVCDYDVDRNRWEPVFVNKATAIRQLDLDDAKDLVAQTQQDFDRVRGVQDDTPAPQPSNQPTTKPNQASRPVEPETDDCPF